MDKIKQWSFDPFPRCGGWAVLGADGLGVATAIQRDASPTRGNGITDAEAREHAHLIAAAPELLAALIAARTELELFAADDGEHYNNPVLNDAIAKATGVAP